MTWQGTPYEGHVYAISLRFHQEYPFKAPTVRFESTCFREHLDAIRTCWFCLKT